MKIGDKFGRLTVSDTPAKVKGRLCVMCLCDCGGYKIANVWNLKNGAVRSCGCLAKELAKSAPRNIN